MTSVGITTQLKYCRTGPPSGISRLWPAGGGSHTTVSTSPPYNTASREEPGGPPCQEMSPVRWLARPGGVVSTVDPWRVRDIGQCLCRHNIQTHTATRLSSPNTSWSADTLPLSTPLCLHLYTRRTGRRGKEWGRGYMDTQWVQLCNRYNIVAQYIKTAPSQSVSNRPEEDHQLMVFS